MPFITFSYINIAICAFDIATCMRMYVLTYVCTYIRTYDSNAHSYYNIHHLQTINGYTSRDISVQEVMLSFCRTLVIRTCAIFCHKKY